MEYNGEYFYMDDIILSGYGFSTNYEPEKTRIIVGGNDCYIAQTSHVFPFLVRSTDKKHWEQIKLPYLGIFEEISFCNGRFFLTDLNAGKILTSVDGKEWIECVVPDFFAEIMDSDRRIYSDLIISKITHINGVYILNTGFRKLYSIDGKEWVAKDKEAKNKESRYDS